VCSLKRNKQPSLEIFHSKTVLSHLLHNALFLCFSAKPKSEVHVSIATPVTVSLETISNQNAEQPTVAVPPTAQQPPPTIPSMIAAASPPSQPAIALSTIPGAVPVTPPITTIAATPTLSAPVGGTPSTVLGPPVPEIKVKEEAEPVDITRPVSSKFIF
jgi:histone deacetylase complex subunit SAP130